jgi:hypothetical protein
MDVVLTLLGQILVLGLGILICHNGYIALRDKLTKVKGKKITGFWAQIVGILNLIIGIPLFGLSIWLLFYLIF